MGMSEVVMLVMMGRMVVLAMEIEMQIARGSWSLQMDRNVDGSRILEFADGLNLVICNTLKQESKLVTYLAGPVKSTVDYITARPGVKAKVGNVKVIPNEEL